MSIVIEDGACHCASCESYNARQKPPSTVGIEPPPEMKPGKRIKLNELGVGMVLQAQAPLAGWSKRKGDLIKITSIWPQIMPSGYISSYLEAGQLLLVDVDEALRSSQKAAQRIFVGNGNGFGMSGSDPEMFIVDAEGVVIPAFKFLKKQEPFDIANYEAGSGTPFWDGYQAEFNVIPYSCHDSLVHSFRLGLLKLHRAATAHDASARLSYASMMKVPVESLQNDEFDYVNLGCAPSTNIYGDEEPLRIGDPRTLEVRFAGCHMHFSYPYLVGNAELRERTVKFMDSFWGIMSTAIMKGIDVPERRQYYGKAGEYRLPSYGIEYRTPSSAILAHPTLTYLNFDLARYAMMVAALDQEDQWVVDGGEDRVRHIVNAGDWKDALDVIRKNSEFVNKAFKNLWLKWDIPSRDEALQTNLWNMVEAGAKEHLPIEDGVEKNWRLDLGEKPLSKVWAPSYRRVIHFGQKDGWWKS